MITIRVNGIDEDHLAGIADRCCLLSSGCRRRVVVVHGTTESERARAAHLKLVLRRRGLIALLAAGRQSRPLIHDIGAPVCAVIATDATAHDDAVLVAAEHAVPLVIGVAERGAGDHDRERSASVAARYLVFATPDVHGYALGDVSITAADRPVTVATGCHRVEGVTGRVVIRVGRQLLAVDIAEPRPVSFRGRAVTIAGGGSLALVTDGSLFGPIRGPVAVDPRSAEVTTLVVTP